MWILQTTIVKLSQNPRATQKESEIAELPALCYSDNGISDNFIFVSSENVAITYFLTENIFSSWIEFDVRLLLIDSQEMIWSLRFVKFSLVFLN